jgi:ketosteroid isomerase-like protein
VLSAEHVGPLLDIEQHAEGPEKPSPCPLSWHADHTITARSRLGIRSSRHPGAELHAPPGEEILGPMSAEDLETVRRGLETFSTTGKPDWTTLDEDVEVRDHDIPDQAGYHGHDGFARWLEDWGAAWAGYTIEPHEFVDAGDRIVVVLRMHATGRGSGLELDREDAMVLELREGKIVQIDYYNDKRRALAAAGITQ